jgi:hypothetical protein
MFPNHTASRPPTPGVERARWLLNLALSALLVAALSGCLGTDVRSPARSTESYSTLRWHLIAAPNLVHASPCRLGLADVTTYVPLWGLAIGILTFGIVVPQWTIFSCVERR